MVLRVPDAAPARCALRDAIKTLARLFCLACVSASCSTVSTETPAWVSFDWFQYEGNDAVFDLPLKENHYRNPVIAGFHPDPSIVRVGLDYYLVTSSFAYFPGLPVFHSTDLVNWRQIGHALTRRSQLKLESGERMSRGIFAPTIRYHDGLFYIITTDVDGIGNFYVTAENPAGPWSDPFPLPQVKGIDPDLFFDDDGRVYVTYNSEPQGPALYDGHRAIWLAELDLAENRVRESSKRVIVNGGVDLSRQPIWIEGPHLYKHNGWYYLLCAEGGTADQHSEVVFRTRSLDEAFVAYANNPILTQRDLDPDRPDPVTSTGHADLVMTPGGDWWAVFLGIRPYPGGFHNTGRETFMLPVHWTDEWPRILDPGVPVPWQAERPAIEPAARVEPPLTGNFTWRDEFDRSELEPGWVRLRTSDVAWAKLDPSNGELLMRALPIGLEEKTQPAFLARVQQNLAFGASTRLALPRTEAVVAGLAIFQSSDFNYFAGVRRTGNRFTVTLEEVREGVVSTLARSEFITSGAHIVLGMEQRDARLSFYYTLADGGKTWLDAQVDAKTLSTQVAGGFVGVTLGLHARELR
jgi:alpha-N-arabinofuranosidase